MSVDIFRYSPARSKDGYITTGLLFAKIHGMYFS